MPKIFAACLFMMLALSSCTGATVVHFETDAYGRLADVKLGTSSGDHARDRAIANEARRQFSTLVPNPKPYRDYVLTVTPTAKSKEMDAKAYGAMQKELRNDAAQREKFVKLCRKQLGNPADLAEMTTYTHTPRSKALEVGCQRLAAALANGRLSYSTFEKTRRGVKTKEMIAILAGR
ncbi:hypothetical protein ADU59_22200 [Pararhizobium polonicum]|uniref:Uncharacterized protein n=1 Tax=Pararhizobium polonicum TaxID=1612624 RepID=A0A1C7NWY0_9HYPH|nr:hypothetical protein [Pararhizobium polonicum]OBZ93186.1 hypothetical protein ADU59_22200 [Pararhizobium polonicum]